MIQVQIWPAISLASENRSTPWRQASSCTGIFQTSHGFSRILPQKRSSMMAKKKGESLQDVLRCVVGRNVYLELCQRLMVMTHHRTLSFTHPTNPLAQHQLRNSYLQGWKRDDSGKSRHIFWLTWRPWCHGSLFWTLGILRLALFWDSQLSWLMFFSIQCKNNAPVDKYFIHGLFQFIPWFNGFYSFLGDPHSGHAALTPKNGCLYFSKMAQQVLSWTDHF